MRASGWRTHSVGKMHFTPTYLDVGYDEMELSEQNGPGRLDDDYHRWLHAEGQHDEIDLVDQEQEYRNAATQEYWDTVGAIESNLTEEHHSTTWIGDRAVE
jgi:arylsulfatase A-like enzyme